MTHTHEILQRMIHTHEISKWVKWLYIKKSGFSQYPSYENKKWKMLFSELVFLDLCMLWFVLTELFGTDCKEKNTKTKMKLYWSSLFWNTDY